MYVYFEGVLYFDVKFLNVCFFDDGIVKLMDFGIVCLLIEDGELMFDVDFFGIFGYVLLECMVGDEVDSCSDVFFFGVIVYVLVCGSVLWFMGCFEVV